MISFNIAEFQRVLGDRKLFVFREYGKQCYPMLRDFVATAPLGETVLVEFEQDIVVDYSFIDETIGQVYHDLVKDELGERYMLFRPLSSNQFDNLKASFTIRQLLAIVLMEGGQWTFVGHREQVNRQEAESTLTLLYQHRHLTAKQLSDLESIKLTAANNRLARLYRAKLAKREPDPKDPRQFIYYSLVV